MAIKKIYADRTFVEEHVREQLNALPDVNEAIATHNTSTTAHDDIRDLIEGLTTRLNTLADSDDTTLDQLSEIVSYIKNNKTLIEGVTSSKVNVADIVDNLTSTATNKPLSAAQGKALKDLIDTLDGSLATVATSGSYNDLSDKPTIPAAVTVDTALSTTSTNPVQNKVINTALGNKVDKVSGKGLSTNDFTTTLKNKLDNIAEGATANTGTITGVTAGNGLTGGATSGSASLAVGAGTGINVTADAVSAKLRSTTALTYDSAAATTTSGRIYPVAVDKSGYLAVNVPWTGDSYTLPVATSSTLGGVKTGYTTDTTNKNYAIQIDGSNNLYVNVPWTDTDTNTDTEVTQTVRTTNGNFPLLLRGTSAGTTTTTTTTTFASAITANPSTGTITATGLSAGTLVLSAATALGTAQARNITISTTDLTAGSSTLATGSLYFVYE